MGKMYVYRVGRTRRRYERGRRRQKKAGEERTGTAQAYRHIHIIIHTQKARNWHGHTQGEAYKRRHNTETYSVIWQSHAMCVLYTETGGRQDRHGIYRQNHKGRQEKEGRAKAKAMPWSWRCCAAKKSVCGRGAATPPE